MTPATFRGEHVEGALIHEIFGVQLLAPEFGYRPVVLNMKDSAPELSTWVTVSEAVYQEAVKRGTFQTRVRECERNKMTPAQLKEAAKQTTLAYFNHSPAGDVSDMLVPAFLKDLAKEPPTYETMNALVLGIIDGTAEFAKSCSKSH